MRTPAAARLPELAKRGCGSSPAGIDDVVRDAVLAATPEISEVTIVTGNTKDAAFIPLQAVTAHSAVGGV